MQSVTWEAVRGLFEKRFKRSAGARQIEALWQQYREGRIEKDALRSRILETAGEIDGPSWYQSDRSLSTQT
jgi:hypothetical protein